MPCKWSLQSVAFWVWLLSLSIMPLRFIYVVCITNSFLYLLLSFIPMSAYITVYLCLPVGGHLSFYYFLVVMCFSIIIATKTVLSSQTPWKGLQDPQGICLWGPLFILSYLLGVLCPLLRMWRSSSRVSSQAFLSPLPTSTPVCFPPWGRASHLCLSATALSFPIAGQLLEDVSFPVSWGQCLLSPFQAHAWHTEDVVHVWVNK